MSSKWTHPICEEDFEERTGRPVSSAVKLIEPDEEVCCICDERTTSGLYIRMDPKDCIYNGIH